MRIVVTIDVVDEDEHGSKELSEQIASHCRRWARTQLPRMLVDACWPYDTHVIVSVAVDPQTNAKPEEEYRA